MFINTSGKFVPQQAVDGWKKAKPLLLTNTGVSDLLRTLPFDPPQAKLAAYPATLAKLEAAMKDQKMQKEKKALACLDVIVKDMKHYLQHIHTGRVNAIDGMKEIHKAAQTFYADAGKGPQSSSATASWYMTTKMARHYLEIGYATAAPAIPEQQGADYSAAIKVMDTAVQKIESLFADAKTGKPKMDMKNELPKQLAEFKKGMDKLPSIWSALAGMKP
jgi:hypothetical protein